MGGVANPRQQFISQALAAGTARDATQLAGQPQQPAPPLPPGAETGFADPRQGARDLLEWLQVQKLLEWLEQNPGVMDAIDATMTGGTLQIGGVFGDVVTKMARNRAVRKGAVETFDSTVDVVKGPQRGLKLEGPVSVIDEGAGKFLDLRRLELDEASQNSLIDAVEALDEVQTPGAREGLFEILDDQIAGSFLQDIPNIAGIRFPRYMPGGQSRGNWWQIQGDLRRDALQARRVPGSPAVFDNITDESLEIVTRPEFVDFFDALSDDMQGIAQKFRSGEITGNPGNADYIAEYARLLQDPRGRAFALEYTTGTPIQLLSMEEINKLPETMTNPAVVRRVVDGFRKLQVDALLDELRRNP